MSTLTLPVTRSRRLTRSSVLANHGSDVLLLVGILAIAIGLLATLTSAFSVDTWLALADGRLVAQSGIPQHDTMTVMSLGKPWIDQQWLAQLAIYGIYQLGGLALLGLVNVTLIAGSLGGAVLAARRLGARAGSVLVVLPLCVWLAWPSHEVRTQVLAVPLFVLTAYLLARDNQSPSARV
jgi:hypothetical protein